MRSSLPFVSIGPDWSGFTYGMWHQFGRTVARLIEGVQQMAIISQTHQDTSTQFLGAAENQTDAVRRMLVAVIDDVRVALIKLAERTAAIRAVKSASHAAPESCS